MNLNITWVPVQGFNPTDEYDILYKVHDPNGLTNWSIANPTPLPYTETSYLIQGLDENTVYDIAVAKSCVGTTDILSERSGVVVGVPLVSTWQGPMVNGKPTLFYSVFYPEGIHVYTTSVTAYDTSTYDNFLINCSAGTTALAVTGRSIYQLTDVCTTPNAVLCGTDAIQSVSPSNISSAAGYLGYDAFYAYNNQLQTFCDSYTNASNPLLFEYNTQYKLGITTNFIYPYQFISSDPLTPSIPLTAPSFTFLDNPSDPYPNLNSPNSANISVALCFDATTGKFKVTQHDGLGRTDISQYYFEYYLKDSLGNQLPLTDNIGVPYYSNYLEYFVFCGIVNPGISSSDLSSTTSVVVELTTNTPSTITVLTLNNMPYGGLTEAQVLTNIAFQINALGGIYTARYIPSLGLFKINVPGVDIVSATIYLNPNVPNSLGPSIAQGAISGAGITSSVTYGNFIYGARGNDSTCNIQVTDQINETTVTVSHTIPYSVNTLEIVPLPPPDRSFTLQSVDTSGSYMIIPAVKDGGWNDGYLYTWDNTSINVYAPNSAPGDPPIDSINGIGLGISTQVDTLHFNLSDGYLYLFSLTYDAYYVVNHSALATWSLVTSGSFAGGFRITGDVLYNPIDTSIYVSIDSAQVIKIDTSYTITTIQLLEVDGITNATGIMGMALDTDTGDIYCTQINYDNSGIAYTSQNIYVIQTGIYSYTIDGSTRWNTAVSGRGSVVAGQLYITTKTTRELIRFDTTDLSGNTWIPYRIPYVYERVSTTGLEHINSALVFNDGSGDLKFVMLNHMNNTTSSPTINAFDISNVIVYNHSTRQVDYILAGADLTNPLYGSISIGYQNTGSYINARGIVIAPQVGKIYLKQAVNISIQRFDFFAGETGIAQLWGAAGYFATTCTLIRIWNIQSDGSLVESKRTICQSVGTSWGAKNITMKYSGFYGKMIIHNSNTNNFGLSLINTYNFIGYIGGNASITGVYQLEVPVSNPIDGTSLTTALTIACDSTGKIVLFGLYYDALTTIPSDYGYAVFTNNQLNTLGQYPTITLTGRSGNTGLFNTDTLTQVYNPNDNTIWVTGRMQYNAGDTVIWIYDIDTNTFTDVIDLTNTGTEIGLGYALDTANNILLYTNYSNCILFNTSTKTFINQFAASNTAIAPVVINNIFYIDTVSGTEDWTSIVSSSNSYTGNVYSILETWSDDPSFTNLITYTGDLYTVPEFPTPTSLTFGQFKDVTSTTWITIPSTIATSVGMILEFTSFILDKPLVTIRNITQGTTYSASNDLNSVTIYSITADGSTLATGDTLEFEFANPQSPDCPFINRTTITF
jgi:hypothetical protein